MELRPGYKLTELGTVPAEWSLFELGDMGPYVTSGSRGWARYYSDYGSAFLRITNLSRQSIHPDLSDLKFVNIPPNDTEGRRTQLHEGDLLVSITADIGIIGYVDRSIPTPTYINQHIALVRLDPERISGKFLSYFLASEKPQRLFRATTDQGAKAGMSLTGVKKIKAILAPLPEQNAIAEALSDADALIESLEQLIAKKRQIKQGAMQELLSGKKRFPGFDSDWIARSLGEVAPLQRGFDLPYRVRKHGVVPIVTSSGVEDTHSEAKVRAPGVVTGRYGTIGKVFFLKEDFWPLNTTLYVRKFLGNDPLFISYLLRTIDFHMHSGKSGVPGVNRNDLHEIVVGLPQTKVEQEAIAGTLSDMDAEIGALENKLTKVAQLKQGMMQELLTGRIRLV
jgi:type I restriction enzyme, S subunit